MRKVLAEKLEKVTETLSVYQDDSMFPYGTDATLLSAYVKSHIKERCAGGIELCSGSGYIALSLLDRCKSLRFSALEINERACELSQMSAQVSGLGDRFSVKCGDICRVREYFSPESFDFAVCNPPYMTNTSGFMCDDEYKNIARHEILCNIEDVFRAASYLLRTNSDFYIVYRPDRLSSLFAAAKKSNFEIKKMTLVHSKVDRAPVLVLCQAKKGAAEGLLSSRPFFIYGSNGEYSEEMKEVCEKGEMPYVK